MLDTAWQTLNSVAKFVDCVQTLESRLDEAEIAANFNLQKRCQGESNTGTFLSQFEASIQRKGLGKDKKGGGSSQGKAVPHVVWTQISQLYFLLAKWPSVRIVTAASAIFHPGS